MSVLRPRNRLVNFRLSEDEFDRLKNSCAHSGARSISDFARSSVLNRLEATASPEASPQLASLDVKVTDLESRVVQLINLLTGMESEGETARAAAVAKTADYSLRR